MTKAVLIEGHIVEKNSNKQERYSETIIKSQFEPQISFMLNSGHLECLNSQHHFSIQSNCFECIHTTCIDTESPPTDICCKRTALIKHFFWSQGCVLLGHLTEIKENINYSSTLPIFGIDHDLWNLGTLKIPG